MSGKVFRRWCSPKTVLVVMRPFDDPAQVLSAIRYAEGWGSRLLLVQLTDATGLGGSQAGGELASPWIPEPAGVQSDYGRKVLSAEVLKRALLLKDVTIQQLPAVVRTFNIDRVMVTQARGHDRAIQPGLEEHLTALLEVPVWILGRGMPLSLATPRAVRRILLPIERSPELKFSLKFASRIAESQRAILSVLHVFGPSARTAAVDERSPFTVRSWLAESVVEFSSPTCPIEISVRHGDPASEILEFNARKPHDLLILRCSPDRHYRSYSRSRIVTRLCSEMPCPILVLGDSIQQRGSETSPAEPAVRHHRTRLRTEPLGMEG